jgi:hypothetical protein
MSAGNTPPYLPPDDLPVGLVKISASWTAVSVPSDWGALVRDVLGDQCGPVMEDLGLRTLAWPLPAGGGAQWPDAQAAGVAWHGPGEDFLVPGLAGHHVARWVRPPTADRQFTDPELLRVGIEFVAGPLEEAAALGPVAVCRYCGTPTRDALLVDSWDSLSGPGWAWYACRPCWSDTVRGGDGSHLRAVKQGPR